MPTAKLAIDSFWLCLCPSFSPALLRPILRCLKPCGNRDLGQRITRRSFHQQRPLLVNRSPLKDDGRHGKDIYRAEHISRSDHFQHDHPHSNWKKERDFRRFSNNTLESWLDRCASENPSISIVYEILHILIHDRHVKPEARHYRVMILANVEAGHGSVRGVKRLLAEMEKEQVPTDSGVLHAVLKVLAIHPDPHLRTSTLQTLQSRWLPLSLSGHHDLMTGLIRDRQFELALEHLSRMHSQPIPVDPWLYDLLTYNLCDVGEFSSAIDIIKYRLTHSSTTDDPVSPNVYFYLLDTASQALHHGAVVLAWRRRVETGYLNPSTGICHNVLLTASRTGDTRLATDVFRVLGNRGHVHTLETYEMLLDTYVAAEDAKTAFGVLCMMRKVGVEPEVGSTRSLFRWMRDGLEPGGVWEMLKPLKEEGNMVPIAAINVVIEAGIAKGEIEKALAWYRELHTLGPKADTQTFRHVIRGCRMQGKREEAVFLWEEMSALGVRPDRVVLEELVRVCVETGDLDGGYRFVMEMEKRGLAVGVGTWEGFLGLCETKGDSFVQRLRGLERPERME